MHLRQVEWYVFIAISFTGLPKISAKPISLNGFRLRKERILVSGEATLKTNITWCLWKFSQFLIRYIAVFLSARLGFIEICILCGRNRPVAIDCCD